jgi:hypothetical protein
MRPLQQTPFLDPGLLGSKFLNLEKHLSFGAPAR